MAEVKVLIEGYTTADSKAGGGEEKTCPTVSLVKDKNIIMVVDPGVLESQQMLINKLEEHGISASDVNYVCITHSHIDHYRNIGMFPDAKTLEYFGIWDKNVSNDWWEAFSDNIRVLKTPGHDDTSITLIVKTEQGQVAVCGDVFWKENYPLIDAYANNQDKLNESREVVLENADWIVPGHGPMYKVDKTKGEHGNGMEIADIIEQKIKEVKNIFGKTLGLKSDNKVCRKCKRPFERPEDRCECQEDICFKCCECEEYCGLCNCKHKIWKNNR